MYHVYLNWAADVYLFLYFFSFLSLKFQNIKCLVTLFCEAYKVETWYTWAKGCSVVYTKYKQPEYTCSFIFLFFFLSLQLAKIKNLHLQNCFNLPLIAMAGGMWALLTVCYILHVILWAIGWNATKCTHLYYWGRINSWLDFGDLDLIFKVRVRLTVSCQHDISWTSWWF